MKRKSMRVSILVSLAVLTIFLGGCTSLNERVKSAEQSVKQQTIIEEEQLHDNGKNFLLIKTTMYGAAEIMIVLQEWVDRHPDKQLRIITPDPRDSVVWLIYYEDRKEGR